jgi:NAD+ synthetase
VARWERLVRDIAEEHGVYVSYTNLVGSEGGKSFSGSSTLCGPRGDVRVRAPVWDESIVSVTVDLNDLTRARGDSPLLNDLRSAMPHLLSALDRVDDGMTPRLEYDPPTPREGHGLVEANAPSRGAPTGLTPGSGIRVVQSPIDAHGLPPALDIDAAMVEEWLVTFLRDEFQRRGFSKAILGLSGGVDSAVTAGLAARAFGAENVIGVRMPYHTSSPESLEHAQLVADALGIETRTVEISAAVDGYLALEPDADAARRGNVMARMRMIVLFDLSSRYRALPVGTGNKTERLFGYFTWHADDSPPVNPLGDLYKTQVWALARQLGVPGVIIDKPASADLVKGQTDEGDFGISYARADVLLDWLLHGYTPADLLARGFPAAEVELVRRRLGGTHWKRRLPAVAMVSPTAIGEAYLRPVDY